MSIQEDSIIRNDAVSTKVVVGPTQQQTAKDILEKQVGTDKDGQPVAVGVLEDVTSIGGVETALGKVLRTHKSVRVG